MLYCHSKVESYLLKMRALVLGGFALALSKGEGGKVPGKSSNPNPILRELDIILETAYLPAGRET